MRIVLLASVVVVVFVVACSMVLVASYDVEPPMKPDLWPTKYDQWRYQDEFQRHRWGDTECLNADLSADVCDRLVKSV